MAVVIIAADFAHTYVVTMVGLSLLSFAFWIPEYIASWFGIRFHNLFAALASRLGPQTENWSLGFHTYMTNPDEIRRNAGIFWEPGAFAGYLIIALLILAAVRPSLTRKQHLAALCIFTGALLSTFSTAGYIAYPITLLLNFDWRGMNRKHRARLALIAFATAPLVILGSSYAFVKLDFLQAKIRHQITTVERQGQGWRINRLGTLVFDWEYISERPLTGWGINQKTRFALHPWVADDSNGTGNGMSNFIASFGVIGFGTFLLGLGRGARRLAGRSPGYVLGFVAATLLVLQGESFLNCPVFLGLMFLGHASVHGQRLPLLPVIWPGRSKLGYSPVLRSLNANGEVEIGLGFRSILSVHSNHSSAEEAPGRDGCLSV
jgi:O-antigen ligase